MTPPCPDQARDALKLANDVRGRRAKLKAELKAGRRRLRRLARRAAAQPALLADPRDLERAFLDERAERLGL